MKIKDLKQLGDEELNLKEKSFKKELFDLNFQRKYGKVEKPGRFRTLKRDIARIKTLLKEREKDGSKK
ncbi:MAG TPA: 50S ribosomal protein L29 [Candidatus Omnitrophota bacterium]|nr:50S ribosomal protein L29 [Candidatus Omnitrophota bacterium]HPD83958.1 50S ribosomal protein L29 [Candidatus Omnitrophota bacterium]HRZ02815.1 50S ribosomal protein L29 [Candidatus Omnitrophota bacterium]